MIAAKMLDPVLGVDIHMIQPPGPVPPLPIPHPFIGMVIDPMDLAPIIGATVMVNGMPRATAGTGVKNIPPHIPIGGTFIKPPGNEGEIFMGSSTVLADGAPLSFLALPVLSCSDIGMPAPPRPKKKGGSKSLSLPTSVLMAIPAGPPVLVGGPPTIDMMAMAMKLGMAALGKAFKKLKKTKAMKKLSDKLHDAAEGAMKKVGVPKNLKNKVHKGICSVTGHPVDIATGKVFTDHIDFEIPGPIPLVWERTWFSTSTYSGPLGHGWHHAYDMALALDTPNEVLAIRMADGRSVPFPILEIGEESFNRQEKLSLYRDERGYVLRDSDRLYYRFRSTSKVRTDIQKLISIETKSGFAIEFSYSDRGYLSQIKDSAGRIFSVDCDAQGKILTIHAPHPDDEGKTFPIVRYRYDAQDDLVQATDPLDHSFQFEYDQHLLVKETNRNGLSFYFEYDGHDENARCLRTWGDGGIYDHKLTYAGGLTVVENSLGHSTSHFHDGAVVLREIDPLGNETRFYYNEYYDKIAEVDALGHRTSYEYDDRGNQIKITYADGTSVQLSFKDDLLVGAKDQVGGQWAWEYDKDDLLTTRTNSLGNSTKYEYEAGLLQKLIQPNSAETILDYDDAKNVIQITTADGAISKWKYDHLGRNRVSINAKNSIQRKIFDLRGQVIRFDESDGNRRHLSYDSEGNVLHSRDRQYDVRFRYQGMGRLRSREENGTKVEFTYDTEEQLLEIKNEHGSVYSFSRNANGDVELESGFDELKRFYKRDGKGQVTSVLRASGIETKYAYDSLGRVLEINHSNGETEKYGYREDGELISAENHHTQIRFDKDILGQVVKEWQGNHWVGSSYNSNMQRTELTSSLGAQFTYARNLMGDVEQISEMRENSWTTDFKHDELGLEIEKSFSSGLRSKWKRDKLGRPTEHQITGGRKYSRKRKYTWQVNDRLSQLIDTFNGNTQFQHDAVGNLSSAQYGDGEVEYRMPDAVGNLFRNKDRKGRTYGTAGQLLEADGTRYEYDEEGNLIRKIGQEAELWVYEWSAAGRLSKVIRPDKEVVNFTYDALGRRLSKSFKRKTTKWVWDGNVPLHEWIEVKKSKSSKIKIGSTKGIKIGKSKKEKKILIVPTSSPLAANISDEKKKGYDPLSSPFFTTWIFEADSFTPLAKIKGGKEYAIITDHLGTPISMHDESGQSVWGAEISIYGEVRKLEGKKEDCPFRFPGQYEDVETGLYYNRYRYLHPNDGYYLSQDPIRLLSNNPNLYSYVKDLTKQIDIFGLEWVDPNSLNFSQGYVDEKTLEYQKLMEDGDWDFERSPLNVATVDGQDVSLDNRRLLAAQNAGVEKVKINRVNLDDAMPGGGTYGGNLRKKLNSRPKRRPDLPKIKLPDTGTSKKPKVVSCTR